MSFNTSRTCKQKCSFGNPALWTQNTQKVTEQVAQHVITEVRVRLLEDNYTRHVFNTCISHQYVAIKSLKND